MKKALFPFFSLLIVISVFGDFAPPAAAKAVKLQGGGDFGRSIEIGRYERR